MKKTLRILLIVILALSSLKANAVILSGNEVKDAITKQIEKKYQGFTNADLKVEIAGIPFRDLNVPEGKVSYVVKSPSDKFVAREMEKVSVYVNNRCVKTFNASVVIKAYQDVLVASDPIEREKEINLSVVRIEKKEVSNTFGYALTPEDITKGFLSKKFFAAGEVIDKRFVKARPEVLRNSNVTVFFNTNNLTISVDGTALSDGGKGDNICVINRNYNKIYKGTIIGENKVLVKL